jgi:arylsulfatase A-like enzyme
MSEGMVLNVDILPTILRACNIDVKNFTFDGISLNDIYNGKVGRNFFLYQYFENPNVDIKPYPEVKAIRTSQYKLITYPNSSCPDEFYDLKNDPMEIQNLIHDPEYNKLIHEHYAYLFSEILKLE